MLFDIVSAIDTTGAAAIVVAFLALALPNPAARLRAALVLAAWLLVVIALGATDALAAKEVGAPGLALAVAAPIAALCWFFFAWPAGRAALLATPLWAPIALNALRLLGVSFVTLYAAGRLPAPFAPSAGWGDIFIGATAGPLAFLVARYGARANGLVLAWNVIGVLDLVFAIGFGATSSPGPIQVFAGPPTSQMMTTLPWLIVPAFLVPIFLSLHIAIFYRLRRGESLARPSDRTPAHVPHPAGA